MRQHARISDVHVRERLEGFLRASMDGVIVVTSEGLFEDANASFQDLIGRDLAELRGLHLWDIDEADTALTHERLRRVASEGQLRYETRLERPDGRACDVAVSVVFLEDEGGLFLACVQDLTTARETAGRLRSAEERFYLAMTAARNALWDWHVQEGTLSLSREWYAQLGYENQELVPEFETWLELLHPDDRPRMTHYVESFLEAPSECFEARFRLRHKKGHYVSVLSRASPILGTRGEVVRLLGIHIDLTEMFESEEVLRGQWQILLTILDSFPEPVYVADVARREVLYANREVSKRLGRNPVGRSCDEAFGCGPTVCERCNLAADTGAPLPLEVHDRALGGSFLVTVRDIDWPDGRSARLFAAVDITKRKEFERSLEERERRFRATFEQAAVGIAHVAPDGRWLRVNERLCEMVGYTRDALLETSFQDITHPEDLGLDTEPLGRLLEGEIDDYSIEKRLFHRGGELVWVNLTVSLVRNRKGEPEYCIAVIEDIGQRKRVEEELQALTAELRRSNDELESFASVVSHDLQEPVRVIAGYLQLVRSRNEDALDDESHEFVQRAIDGAKRMQELIRDLLSLARVGSHELNVERFSLRGLVDLVLSDLKLAAEECGARIEIGTLPTIAADRNQIRQLMQNLIANAVKFRRGAGPLVRISASESPEEWRISVEDDGLGIEPGYRERIFEIFERVHSRDGHPGTGIGLAICRRIAERHNGRIWVDSEVGRGSIFHVTLPRRV